MHGLPLRSHRKLFAGLEREDKGSWVEWNPLSKHVEEEGEGHDRISGLVISSDDGVPHEGVGLRNTAENTVGVADVAGIGECAES